VAVADDQDLVRDGLAMILDAQPDMEVVGTASDGVEAVEMARRSGPDIVLMDGRMPRLDGVEATRRLVAEGSASRILMLTTYDLDEYVTEALRAGASGFLLKDAPRQKLLAAIRAAMDGDGARDRGAAPGRPRAVQRGDSRPAGGQRDHG